MCGKYINFHTHRPDPRPEVTAVLCVTPEQAMPENSTLAIGIHPWSIDTITPERANAHLERLAVQLHNPLAVAVGETGLDRLHNPDNLPLQELIFAEHLRLAESLKLPVIVHCVRCYSELLSWRKKYSCTTWLIHGFNNKLEILTQLLKHNCYISFGPAVIRGKKEKHELLRAVPLERLCLETDDQDGDIKSIYHDTAAILNLPENDLINAMQYNFTKIFRSIR
jgi:TatD DNase family protein